MDKCANRSKQSFCPHKDIVTGLLLPLPGFQNFVETKKTGHGEYRALS